MENDGLVDIPVEGSFSFISEKIVLKAIKELKSSFMCYWSSVIYVLASSSICNDFIDGLGNSIIWKKETFNDWRKKFHHLLL